MSSTGEASRVLGLASSAITAITSAEEIYEAASDASVLPKEIRAVAAQLPLASNTLRAAKTTFEANQNYQTTELVEPVFDLCQSHGTKLLFIFDKVVPVDGPSRNEQLRKVLQTIGKTKNVEDLLHEIFESLLHLQQNQVFRASVDAARLKTAQDELIRREDGGSQSKVNHETGPMFADIRSASQYESIKPQHSTITQGVMASEAYVSSVRHIADVHQSMMGGLDYCDEISQYVKDENTRKEYPVSRHARIRWALPQFVAGCLGGDTDLADVFTVTGTADVAFGTTCRQYILQHWGYVGDLVLDTVHAMLNQGSGPLRTNIRGVQVDLDYSNFECHARFSGWGATLSDRDSSTVAVVIQTLAWLTSVFRLPRQGGPSCSELSISQMGSYLYIALGSLIPATTKKCWHDIVPNTTIASGFPTGVKEDSGLDINWEVMLELTDVLFQTDLSKVSTDQENLLSDASRTRNESSPAQGIFFSGVGTLLYPIKRYTDSSRDQTVFEWHFDTTGQSALPPEDTILPWCDEDAFARSRHLLGFAPTNEVRLGTRDRMHEYIRMSPVAGCIEPNVPEFSIENIATNLGKAPVTFTFGGKVKYSQPLRGTRDPEKRTYDSILGAAERQAVIICDVGLEKKVWLVSQISVILDLICYRTQKEGYRGLPRYASPQADGGAAAAKLLRDEYVYKTVLAPGLAGDEDLTVSQLVKEIYFAMQERQRLREMSVRGYIRLHRKLLHSWDLLELADPPDEYSRRATAVHTTSSRVVTQYPSWLPLADHIPVYSGQNLGDVMTVAHRPITLQQATRGEKYLMANVHAMQSLMQTRLDCSHCHLNGGLVMTLPLHASGDFEEKLQSEWRGKIHLKAPDIHVQTLTKESEHECARGEGPAQLCGDGLVMFGPERDKLLARLNNWADKNMPAH